MSKRTQASDPTRLSGRKFHATNITSRGNVMVYELPNARTDPKNTIVLYDGPGGVTLWVDADRVGGTPEEAVRVALKLVRAKVTATRKLIRGFEADRDALINVLHRTRPGKIVVKSPKVRA